MLRGYLSIGAIGAFLLCTDLIQRTLIQALVWLLPSRRSRILSAWIHGVAGFILFASRRIGGARFESLPRIPARPGVLILMNHQSLLDIPVPVACLDGGYPLFVTRERYARGVPTVSHLIRLYGHPTVDPGRFSRRQFEALTALARHTQSPLAIFPEGTRSKTGEIRPFRTAGLEAILAPRRWSVYLLVVDGLWRSGKFGELAREIPKIHARLVTAGPFTSPAPGEPLEEFIERMRARMLVELARLREPPSGNP